MTFDTTHVRVEKVRNHAKGKILKIIMIKYNNMVTIMLMIKTLTIFYACSLITGFCTDI
jgi:hypothetical protein